MPNSNNDAAGKSSFKTESLPSKVVGSNNAECVQGDNIELASFLDVAKDGVVTFY